MSWKTVKLGDVCKVIAGQSPEGKYYNNDGVGIPFYQGKKDFGKVYINSPSVWTTEITKEAIKDDILMSVRAPVGPVNISRENICIGRGLAAIRSSEKIDKSYLFNYLLSIEKDLIGSSGAVFNSINKGQIEKLEIPLPPLPIQQKIVDKLDAIFAEIDKAKDMAEANIKNAEALFQSYLKQIFDYKREHWETVRLGDILETSAGGTPLKSIKKYYEGGDIPWLMSGEVCSKEIFTSLHKITKLGVENSSAKLFPTNTTLIAMYGATAGQVGILRFPATTNQAVCGIMPNKNYLPEFLYYYISFYKKTLLLEVSGVAQPNLSQIKIKNIPLPKISLGIQQKMLAKLDEISAQVSNLNQLWKDKVNNLTFLQQSILKQAFNGELIKAA